MDNNNLYNVIKALQNAKGSKAKLALLEANKDNLILSTYIRYTYDPSINYYIKKLPNISDIGEESLTLYGASLVASMLAGRSITGNMAKAFVEDWFARLNEEGQELLTYMLRRDIKAGIDDKTILKVWPDLYFVPPYQRCNPIKSVIAKFKAMAWFYVQKKLDGSFAYLDTTTQALITRQGSFYPQWFSDKFDVGDAARMIYAGELEVYKDGKLLDRKTGNGILNSIQKSEFEEEEFKQYEYKITCWDALLASEFKARMSGRKYNTRLEQLNIEAEKSNGTINVVETHVVTSIAQAFEIYSGYTEQGFEGAIAISPNNLWHDGTATDMGKLKVKFEAEYRIKGWYYGEVGTKNEKRLGGFVVTTSDGKLRSGVGSGFSDKQREEWVGEGAEAMIGKIITVSANDVISKRDSDILSLSLPAFEEVREDKREADTLQRVLDQVDAARKGVL